MDYLLEIGGAALCEGGGPRLVYSFGGGKHVGVNGK